jgi:N utilization substance protein B
VPRLPIGKRRRARELALQFLYQLDVNDAIDPTPFEGEFWAERSSDDEVKGFATTLVAGAKGRQEEIDRLIVQVAEHWELDRMAVVDRNILRLAIFELLDQADVPPKVAINEAIEIAKKFGTGESSRFINGILDRVHKELRPAS